VLALIAERGIEGTSMDAIAAASGVSKATVYKHWTNKEALLLDVIRQQAGQLPEFDSGNPRKDLTELLRYFAQARKPEALVRIWPQIIGYAMTNPDFGKALHEFAFAPRRIQVERLLSDAVAQGELRSGIDPVFAIDLLLGPIMHRRFMDEKNVPPEMPERVVEYFWLALGRRDH